MPARKYSKKTSDATPHTVDRGLRPGYNTPITYRVGVLLTMKTNREDSPMPKIVHSITELIDVVK